MFCCFPKASLTTNGDTPLHIANRNGQTGCAELLTAAEENCQLPDQ
ncbi:ankyrin repeat domain-containing protein [Endozoicomonas euniceicola]|uniref:Ankyrin repeat domain-containing protein n=1 Tax=Endozoicomonas euniceicola TaxID=1234143 RepID=A0ABY6GW86_9GAMM|nr:ankyrin repeat domain-containing protein [Endozoicomonas euniceicola]UYM16674.1 ankyrin repeat domain-containing protein [Endozoicomonas euniceicola]